MIALRDRTAQLLSQIPLSLYEYADLAMLMQLIEDCRQHYLPRASTSHRLST